MIACLAAKTNHTRFLFLSFLLLLLAASCKEQEDTAGADFVGKRNPFGIITSDTATLIAYTSTADSFRTRSNPYLYYVLGDLNDPMMGTTHSSLYTQYSLPSSVLGSDMNTIDSIILQLTYSYSGAYYGDPLANQDIKVYELTEILTPDSNYYSNRPNYSYNSTSLIGQYTGNFNHTGDSVPVPGVIPMMTPHLRIRLDNMDPALKNRFLDNATLYRTNNNDEFQKVFKGLAIVASSTPAGTGALAYFNMNSAVTVLKVYHDGGTIAEFPIAVTTSNFTNQYKHTFSPSIALQPKLANLHSDRNYVAPLTGTEVHIRTPYLFDYVKNNRIAITGAEMVFTLADGSDDATFKYPSTLQLLGTDSTGRGIIIADMGMGASYYGGSYNNRQYRFNVIRQVQDVLNQYKNLGRDINYGFTLIVPAGIADAANRAVINTERGTGKFKLNLTYTVIQ